MLDADNPMPLVCDRCGVYVTPYDHMHFDFQTWFDGDNQNWTIPSGRLCLACGDEVSEALVNFAHLYGLTHKTINLPSGDHHHLGYGGYLAYLGY